MPSLPRLRPHYRDYLVHSTRIIQVRNPSISQLLTDDVQYDTVADMQPAADQPCQCAHLAKRLGIPLVQGHLFIRHPRLLRHVSGIDSRVLLQHGNNDACPTWKTVRKSVVRSAREVLLKLLPERIADMQPSAFYSTLLACAKRCWRAQHITAPWYIWEQKIRDIKEKWGHAWVFEGCNKNMGKIAATCRVGMLQRVLHDIADPLQFEVLHIAPDARGARKWALAHLHHNASLHGLQKHWSSGPRKGPPTVRYVPKNKLDELLRWKCTPQPFCMDLIPVTVWQHHIWPFFPSAAALWTLCTVNTYMLRWAYRALHGCLRFEPWDALYWHSRRLWLSLGLHRAVNRVPGHWASAPRMLSPLRDIDWKTRLVFSHYTHRMRARGRQISRCLQLLVTEGTRVLHTLEMPTYCLGCASVTLTFPLCGTRVPFPTLLLCLN